MLENYLIEYCAPTLAFLKSGNIFNYKCKPEEPVDECVSEWNGILSKKGICVHLLRRTETSALIYVYRQSALEDTLSDPDICSFLKEYGYDVSYFCEECTASCCSLGTCLEHLRSRITGDHNEIFMKFPHEIGIFLGYPLEDVAGFIMNEGRNSKCTGTWKVYGDLSSARKSFEKFNKCSDVYNRLWESGRRSILQLTVAG